MRAGGAAAGLLTYSRRLALLIWLLAYTHAALRAQEWDGLVSLVLGHNNFSGPLPPELFDMQLVASLDISHNQCAAAARAACANALARVSRRRGLLAPPSFWRLRAARGGASLVHADPRPPATFFPPQAHGHRAPRHQPGRVPD